MIPKVIDAKYKNKFIIHICFADGTEGNIDFSQELYGEIFEPLKDENIFRNFQIHPDFHTLCWQNAANFAPEFLYEKLQSTGCSVI